MFFVNFENIKQQFKLRNKTNSNQIWFLLPRHFSCEFNLEYKRSEAWCHLPWHLHIATHLHCSGAKGVFFLCQIALFCVKIFIKLMQFWHLAYSFRQLLISHSMASVDIIRLAKLEETTEYFLCQIIINFNREVLSSIFTTAKFPQLCTFTSWRGLN